MIGHIENGIAGQNITAPAFCYIDPADGKVYKASAATKDHPSTCIVFANAVTDGDCQVVYGPVTMDWETGLEVGEAGYLSAATAGALTATAPTNKQSLGVQIAGGRFRVDIQPFGGSSAYLVYTAQWSQENTDNPVVVVLENTLGATIAWTYDGSGVYTATASAAIFSAAKIFVSVTNVGDSTPENEAHVIGRHVASTVIRFYAGYRGTLTDGFVLASDPAMLEIRVYP